MGVVLLLLLVVFDLIFGTEENILWVLKVIGIFLIGLDKQNGKNYHRTTIRYC
jgi:hypothetical protein